MINIYLKVNILVVERVLNINILRDLEILIRLKPLPFASHVNLIVRIDSPIVQ